MHVCKRIAYKIPANNLFINSYVKKLVRALVSYLSTFATPCMYTSKRFLLRSLLLMHTAAIIQTKIQYIRINEFVLLIRPIKVIKLMDGIWNFVIEHMKMSSIVICIYDM